MTNNSKTFKDYYSHLKTISFLGRIYKRYVSSPILLKCARQFGLNIMEVGSGVGSGLLGAYRMHVKGLDINSEAIEYCKTLGLNAQLINNDGIFPVADGEFDCCVLDNVLEHIIEPQITLDECYRVTKQSGGLIIAVPGEAGYQSDSDHKKFYDEHGLKNLDDKWQLLSLFSIPFFWKNKKLSSMMKQYCLVAVYKKVESATD